MRYWTNEMQDTLSRAVTRTLEDAISNRNYGIQNAIRATGEEEPWQEGLFAGDLAVQSSLENALNAEIDTRTCIDAVKWPALLEITIGTVSFGFAGSPIGYLGVVAGSLIGASVGIFVTNCLRSRPFSYHEKSVELKAYRELPSGCFVNACKTAVKRVDLYTQNAKNIFPEFMSTAIDLCSRGSRAGKFLTLLDAADEHDFDRRIRKEFKHDILSIARLNLPHTTVSYVPSESEIQRRKLYSGITSFLVIGLSEFFGHSFERSCTLGVFAGAVALALQYQMDYRERTQEEVRGITAALGRLPAAEYKEAFHQCVLQRKKVFELLGYQTNIRAYLKNCDT